MSNHYLDSDPKACLRDMGRNIVVSRLEHVPVGQADVKLVERKEMGHPDSIADGIAEA